MTTFAVKNKVRSIIIPVNLTLKCGLGIMSRPMPNSKVQQAIGNDIPELDGITVFV